MGLTSLVLFLGRGPKVTPYGIKKGKTYFPANNLTYTWDGKPVTYHYTNHEIDEDEFVNDKEGNSPQQKARTKGMKTKEHSEKDLTYFQTTENETRIKNKGDNSQEPMKNHPYHIIPKWLPCSNRQQRLLDYVAGPEQGQVKS